MAILYLLEDYCLLGYDAYSPVFRNQHFGKKRAVSIFDVQHRVPEDNTLFPVR
jgi:hypothetical protein